ncbi:hypothetical protein Fmac_003826 [Flemingia macrophylla]|uniref:Ninja-family protein n=1 Tax=Flemingia macrophylla TaxID=520843 RepID=A0ABD1N3S8_9FABA
MEDENGLELSLGLSFGGSSVKPKSKNGSPSDTRAEDVRNRKMVDDLKSMFDAGPQKPNSVNDTETDPSKPEENFFNEISKAKENASLSLNGTGFWGASSKSLLHAEEDKQLDKGIKRKMFFDKINSQKKQSVVRHADLNDKARTSHISLTNVSASENEDVANFEAENFASRPISCQNDGTKQVARVGISSEAQKDVCGVADSSVTDFNEEKRLASTEKDFKHANLTYSASLCLHQSNMINAPYPSLAKESNSVDAKNPQIYGVMPTATGELSGSQPVSNDSLPVLFGYSSVQLPMLDNDNRQDLVSCPLELHPTISNGRGPPNTAAICAISNNISEGTPYELERFKGDGKHSKQHVTKESSSSQPEAIKGSITKLTAKNASDRSTGEGSSIDFSFIKPGIAADVKFGGGGSCPNLPWVSTSGSGPNGRTISGVTYKFNTNKIRIVCACHGSHMTPEEFVRHANDGQE